MRSHLYGAGAEYALHSLLILATSDAPISVMDLARFQKILSGSWPKCSPA